MADANVQRKARGAFYTPPEMADFLVRWAVRSPDDEILEPSCGDAAFLIPISRRLRSLGAGLFAGDRILGVEVHPDSAEAARARMRDEGIGANIIVSDFFDFEAREQFDAVIGNPPYIRYQGFKGAERKRGLEAALRAGVRLTGLASSWASFVVHATSCLRANGRLALVLPAELLSVHYAAPIRQFLLQRFREIKLVTFEELVFPGVQEEVVLLLAEGSGGATHFQLFQARNLADLSTMHADGWATFTPDQNNGKWTPALLSNNELDVYQTAIKSNYFVELLNWGDTYLGSVTGENKFFALTRAEVLSLGLTESELCHISPPGSRHLRGLSFTHEAWEQLARDGHKCYLFYPDDESVQSEAAARYIEAGVTTSVSRRYKCRTRKPWWQVPLMPMPDLFLTYMDADRPRLVTNRASVYHLNSLYGVMLREGNRQLGCDLLPIAALNSLTVLGAEIVGRAYGGGMLKLEPTEADLLPVPSEDVVREAAKSLRAIRPQLAQALRQNDVLKAVKLVDKIVLTQTLGYTHADIAVLRNARAALLARRTARSAR